MPPSESTILNNYLVAPAQLPAIISLEQFTAFFPASQRSSPQIPALYRDLQRQRNGAVDGVAQNIDAEARHRKAIRREVAEARKEPGSEEVDQEDEVENALFGSSSLRDGDTRHTLGSIISGIDAAVEDLERKIQDLEAEESKLLQSVKQTVGGLSDLRYGRLANPKLREQGLEGLQNLQNVCERKI